MKTIKWFKIGIPVNIEKLAQKIKDKSFSKELSKGFVLKKTTQNEISGKYVEERIFTKEIINPFGVLENHKIPDFYIVEFSIVRINSHWLLEIHNTPRSIKPLTDSLSKLIGIGFYIENIELDLYEIVKKIECDIGKLKITKMELYNINIENTALAQMLVTSQKDVRKSLDSYLINNKGYTIHSITAKFIHHDLFTGHFEIRSNSRVDVYDIPSHSFVNIYMPIFLDLIFEPFSNSV